MSFQNDYLILALFVLAWYGFSGFANENPNVIGEANAVRYYATLSRVAPAGWVFGVAWFILYGLVATSHFLYWRDGSKHHAIYIVTLSVFLLNLLLNKLWSQQFFGSRQPKAALGIVIGTLATALAIAICMAIDETWLAFGLFVPYVIWLAFATYLNWQFISAYYSTSAEKMVNEAKFSLGMAEKPSFKW